MTSENAKIEVSEKLIQKYSDLIDTIQSTMKKYYEIEKKIKDFETQAEVIQSIISDVKDISNKIVKIESHLENADLKTVKKEIQTADTDINNLKFRIQKTEDEIQKLVENFNNKIISIETNINAIRSLTEEQKELKVASDKIKDIIDERYAELKKELQVLQEKSNQLEKELNQTKKRLDKVETISFKNLSIKSWVKILLPLFTSGGFIYWLLVKIISKQLGG